MRCIGLKSAAVAAATLLIGAASVSTAFGVNAAAAPARVELTDDGAIFVTPAGMSLYTWGPDDSTPGKPRCTNVPVKGFHDPTAGYGTYPLPRRESQQSCAEKWPPFMAGADAVPGGDWALIDRPEGGRQWTYRGHPLYTSTKDLKPGQRNGAFRIGQLPVGARGWSLAAAPLDFPPGLKLVRRAEELLLAAPNGALLYAPRGARLRQACAGCEELFQPLLAPAIANVSGDWSIVSAGAGRWQYAFRGKPLYTAPQRIADGDAAGMRDWQPVIYRKGAGLPRQIGTRLSLVGDVYTDHAGRTLYAFTCSSPSGDGVRCDDPGDAAGYWVGLCGAAAECARRWHPYLATPEARPQGDWSVVAVAYPMFTDPLGPTYPPEAPRVQAWAYRGMPVYTYYEDQEPGDIRGHFVRWFSLSGFYAVQVQGRSLYD